MTGVQQPLADLQAIAVEKLDRDVLVYRRVSAAAGDERFVVALSDGVERAVVTTVDLTDGSIGPVTGPISRRRAVVNDAIEDRVAALQLVELLVGPPAPSWHECAACGAVTRHDGGVCIRDREHPRFDERRGLGLRPELAHSRVEGEVSR
jgi:hypothetical protein